MDRSVLYDREKELERMEARSNVGSRMGGMSVRSLTSKHLVDSKPGQKRFDPNARRLKQQASEVGSEQSRKKVVKK